MASVLRRMVAFGGCGGPVVAALALLGAACTSTDAEHIEPVTTRAGAAVTATDAPEDDSVAVQLAAQARPVIADGGTFPVSQAQVPALKLLDAVEIGGGRLWVPWPSYPSAAQHGAPSIRGSQSALLDDMERGYRHIVAQRSQWDSEMPPYTAEARAAFADGKRVARRRAGTETAWELIVDPGDLDYETRIADDQTAAYDHVSLCPPHPTAPALGVDFGDSAVERDRAATVIEAFIVGMRSPGGRPVHSWGTTANDVSQMLVYSPGEPMELATGGHGLTDRGYFPGDWSSNAKQWLMRRAAQGAVTDSLVGHAIVSTGPQSIWEACSDLAAIIPGVYTASHRTRQLESLWARGLRLQFTSPPVERAWVADISAAGHALAVVCHQAGRSHLVDASTGERLDAGEDQPAQVEAMWLTWSRLSYRVLDNALFEGDCDSDAFHSAVEWIRDAKQQHEASVDWTQPHAWGSGVRNEWVAVREWVEMPQAEVWRAHRDHSWHLEFWCRIGIPVGELVDGELRRPDLEAHCLPTQWAALSAAAAGAPAVTSELSATHWQPDATWHERMYLSPFKSLDEILGCEPDAALIAEALERPTERRVKRPWPPGSLDTSESEWAYPRPMPPCPEAGWPPQRDSFWWPPAPPLEAVAQ